MPRPKKILLADDETNFSETCAEYLTRRGYEVKTVATPEDCAQVLQHELMHLLILDLRLRGGGEEDASGLALAKELGPHLPKIILTAFPTWEAAREALTPNETLPPAVFFLSKMEGLAVLHDYVKRAFAKHVPLNWDLQISWRERDAAAFARLLEPALPRAQEQARADELEDLFRRLFPAAEHLRVERLCWQRQGRAAVEAVSARADEVPESTLVVLGARAALSAEAENYRRHAPENFATLLRAHAAGPLLAANAYTLTGCDFEKAQKLSDRYRAASGRPCAAALTRLVEQVLPAWAHDQIKLEEVRTLAEVYRAHPALAAVPTHAEALTTQLQTLARRLPLLGLTVALRGEELVWRFNDDEQRLPNPALWLGRLPSTPPGSLRLLNSPGLLDGDTVLAQEDGQVWLTDFSAAGFAPAAWNYVALEAAVRFDWLEPSPPQRLRELAECLSQRAFADFDPREHERELQKPLRLIQSLRKEARRQPGHDAEAYQQGLFFHALQLLATSDAAQASQHLLARLTHALLSAGLYLRQLADGAPASALSPKLEGLELDEPNFAVRVAGRRVSLTSDEYKLLSYLASHAEQVCTHEELIEQVLEQRFVRGDMSQLDALQQRVRRSQMDVLQQRMHRLRAAIEPDPKQPRYLHAVPKRGYRLTLKP